MAGGKSCFNGKWCVEHQGEIFSAAPSHQAQARQILNRVAGLASTKMNCNIHPYHAHTVYLCDFSSHLFIDT
jgi:hypothetical protein